MKVARLLAASAVAALVGAWGFAGAGPGHLAQASAAAGQKVDNFELTDQNLLGHSLYSMADAKAIVIITQGNGCPVVRNNGTAYNALKAAYKDKGVEFMMLNANTQDSREDILKEAADFHYDFPILQDTNQLVGEQLHLERTGEVIVIDPKTWSIVFRGPVDDRVTYERQKAKATKHYAADALDQFLAGRPVRDAHEMAPGCIINLLEASAQPQKISYTHDIAPIIQEKCVSCHQPGGIGPMNLTNYDFIKGQSSMIREVIRTRRMPPFHVDPRIGHFNNDKSLSAEQTKLLVHWIEAGSPRGDGADPLAGQTFHAPEWPLGKPDMVLDIPAFTIKANGVVDYQQPWVAMNATEDHWLRASTIKVDQRQGVHHVLTGFMDKVPEGPNSRGGSISGPSIGGYAVGAESSVMPTDSGTFLPAGGAIGFQMHYSPFGKEVTDHTQVGLYFYDKDKLPTHVMHNSVIADQQMLVPANADNWEDVAYVNFAHDAKLYSAFPHAHYRGRSSKLELQYPDGHRQILLAMPHYDFNWQGAYEFKDPIDIPAGSKLIAYFTYDNSKRNPANPDPNRVVPWGEQSFDEMFYMAFTYEWKEETASHRVNYDTALNASRAFGLLDKNVDGKVEVAELTGSQGALLKPNFSMFDRNGDGGLDESELAAAMAGVRGAGRSRAAAPAPAPAAAAPATRPQG